MNEKKPNKRAFGSAGEDCTTAYLIQQGYKILERNFRVGRLGEIDIIARDGEYICFIEVKARSSTVFGMPSEAVTISKQQRITGLAAIYLDRKNMSDENVRFDVVEVLYQKNRSGYMKPVINLIKNAFQGVS